MPRKNNNTSKDKAGASQAKKAKVAWGNAQKKFMSAERKVQSYIKKHPAKAAIMAGAVAAAIAAGIARSRHTAR